MITTRTETISPMTGYEVTFVVSKISCIETDEGRPTLLWVTCGGIEPLCLIMRSKSERDEAVGRIKAALEQEEQ